MRRGRLWGLVILGISLIISSIIFGNYFYWSRQTVKNIRVTGAATKRVPSDVVKWRVTLSRNADANNMKAGYQLLKDDLQAFEAILKANGIAAKDITVQPINSNPIFSQYKPGTPVAYNVVQNVYVVSKDIPKIEALALNPSYLIDRGIVLQFSTLEYYISNLSAVKRELLAEATADAKRRAAEIVRSTGDKISNIESVKVGVFQITEPYSTDVSDYGIYNTGTKEKDVNVTVNAVFDLE